MTDQKIEPSKVTKPIQLLAAWLVGLILVNGSFLGTALSLKSQPWLPVVLVIAAVINVPVFLYAIFKLQTKYRPEMQEDSFYSAYLDRKTQRTIDTEQPRGIGLQSQQLLSQFRAVVSRLAEPSPGPSDEAVAETLRRYSIALNDYLPQFAAIREKLRDSGFRVNKIFGSTNSPTDESTKAPWAFVINITDGIDPVFVRELLRILLGFKFDGIKVSERLPIDSSDVYLGAYDIDGGYGAITPQLRELVESDFETADLDYYCKKHWVENVG